MTQEKELTNRAAVEEAAEDFNYIFKVNNDGKKIKVSRKLLEMTDVELVKIFRSQYGRTKKYESKVAEYENRASANSKLASDYRGRMVTLYNIVNKVIEVSEKRGIDLNAEMKNYKEV
jgi:hypothetical protein